MPRYPDDEYSPPRDLRRHTSHRTQGGTHVTYRPDVYRTTSGRSGSPPEINIYNSNDAHQDSDNRNQRSRGRDRDDRPAYAPPYGYPYPVVAGAVPVAAPAALPPYDPRYDPRYYNRSHSRHRSHSRRRSHSRSTSSGSGSHHSHRRRHRDSRQESDEEYRKRILDEHKRAEAEEEEEKARAIEDYARKQEKKKKDEKEAAAEAVRKFEQQKQEEEEEEVRAWEAHEAKRKAKDEKEKQEKVEADEEYKKRFREHLARIGYAPNQIDAIIEMEKLKVSENKTPGTLVHQPRTSVSGGVIPGVQQQVFPKIRRADIAIETLNHYSLKWEYCRDDPDFIIVFREMTEKETDILFAHTAKLREGKPSKVLQIEERKGRGKEPEFLMVRRKEKAERSKSRTRDRSTSRLAAAVLGLSP